MLLPPFFYQENHSEKVRMLPNIQVGMEVLGSPNPFLKTYRVAFGSPRIFKRRDSGVDWRHEQCSKPPPVGCFIWRILLPSYIGIIQKSHEYK